MAKKRWTAKELAFVENHRMEMTTTEMAKQIGRTRMAVIKVIRVHRWRRPENVALSMERKGNAIRVAMGQGGDKNPNWKGGISSDNYHYKKIQQERYPERTRARALAQQALRSGKIQKQKCEICGAEAVMHHDDYAKPLEVRWLCRKHHRNIHGEMRWYR